MKKNIIILANSIKKGGRCVAGLEILNDDHSAPVLGDWIRAIDLTQPEGTIQSKTSFLSGGQLKPLDIVEIEFERCANDPHHPEDWVIDSATPWRMLNSFSKSILSHIKSSSSDIWGNGKAVSPGSLGATLQLIRIVKPIIVTSGYIINNFNGETKFKSFLTLNTGGGSYEVSITDPLFSSKHNMEPGHIGLGNVKTLELPVGTHLLMSLTPVWVTTGQQYKVIAAIIEP